MIELLLQAERAMSVGLVDRAETLYAQVAEADPQNSIAVVGLARVALERGDEAGALALARRALTIDPENAAAARMVERLDEVLRYRGDDRPPARGRCCREPAAVPEAVAAPEAAVPVPAAASRADPDPRPRPRPRPRSRPRSVGPCSIACSVGTADLDAGLHGEPARLDGGHDGGMVLLGLVGVAHRERGEASSKTSPGPR